MLFISFCLEAISALLVHLFSQVPLPVLEETSQLEINIFAGSKFLLPDLKI